MSGREHSPRNTRRNRHRPADWRRTCKEKQLACKTEDRKQDHSPRAISSDDSIRINDDCVFTRGTSARVRIDPLLLGGLASAQRGVEKVFGLGGVQKTVGGGAEPVGDRTRDVRVDAAAGQDGESTIVAFAP